MIGTVLSLGVGFCVDAVLKIAVPAGTTAGAKIVRTIGTAAISYAVGQEIDRAIERAGAAVRKGVDAACGVEIVDESNGDN